MQNVSCCKFILLNFYVGPATVLPVVATCVCHLQEAKKLTYQLLLCKAYCLFTAFFSKLGNLKGP